MGQQKPTVTNVSKRTLRIRSWRLISQRNVIIGFVIMCVLALVVFAIRSSTRSTTASLDYADVTNGEFVAQGKRSYAIRCASCHGSDLKGEHGWPQRRINGVMPASPLDQSGQSWQQEDHWLFKTIKYGGQATAPAGSPNYMPGFGGGMTDSEIWAVIAYIRSTWPKHIQDAQSRR